MKSLMLQVISLFLLEANLRVFSLRVILRGQVHYSLEFTWRWEWRDFVVAIS